LEENNRGRQIERPGAFFGLGMGKGSLKS